MTIALNDDDALKRIILKGLDPQPKDLAAEISQLLETDQEGDK